jgi:hypothetical protein
MITNRTDVTEWVTHFVRAPNSKWDSAPDAPYRKVDQLLSSGDSALEVLRVILHLGGLVRSGSRGMRSIPNASVGSFDSWDGKRSIPSRA